MTTSPAHSARGLPVAVIGAGLMGRWHAHAATRLGARVVAVIDPDTAAAAALARHHGALAADDLATLPSGTQLEVAHVCAPLAAHDAAVRSALDAGLHVLCEKPLAASAAATRELLAAADAAGRLLCPVHQFAFQPGVETLLARRDDLGRLLRIETTFQSAGAEGPGTPPPDAVVADILPHPLSIAERLWPGALPGVRWQAQRQEPGEVQYLGRHDAWMLAVTVSMHGRPTESTLRAVGTGGSMHLDLFHGFAVYEPGHVSRRRKILLPFERTSRTFARAAANLARRAARREPAYPGLRALIGRFYAAVRGGAPPLSRSAIVQTAEVRDHLIDLASLDLAS